MMQKGQITPERQHAFMKNSANMLPIYLWSTSEKHFVCCRIMQFFAVTAMDLSDK